MNPTSECISKIDVRETLSAVLGDPQCVFTILEATQQEDKNLPIEVPPEDPFDLMIYAANRNTLFHCAYKSENTPERLMSFVKLPRSLQQKILYRCVFVYRLYFKLGSKVLEFPLKLED